MPRPYSFRQDPAVPAFPDDKPLIVFDGVCVLCSGSAQFVLRHDPDGQFRLAAAQSELGQALYRHYGLDPADYDSVLLIEDGQLYLKSDAALRIGGHLGFPWRLASALRPLPRFIRDSLYDLVARNRYRLFGRREVCFRPDAAFAGRFLG